MHFIFKVTWPNIWTELMWGLIANIISIHMISMHMVLPQTETIPISTMQSLKSYNTCILFLIIDCLKKKIKN